jgi:putative thioredoxin
MTKQDIIFDVTTAEFEARVVRASTKVPVVVDFWAEWCAPCRALGPVLERLVGSYKGKVLLARVNVDKEPQLAAQFGVQGIPAVKVFRDGRVAREFVGALPEGEVARVLQSVVPSAADELVRKGDARSEAGDIDGAIALYRQALEEGAGHTGALLRLGSALIERGEAAGARDVLGRIEEDAAEYAAAQGLLGMIEFAEVCQAGGGREAVERRAAAQPDDLEARYALGCCLAAAGEYDGAMEAFLQVLSADRNWRDGAAREAMLHTFELAGGQSEMVKGYRKKMAAAMY